jgi:transposase/uncharacterized coiled-coil protein SlyX
MTDTTHRPLIAADIDLQQLPNDPATLKGMVVELTQALANQQQHAAHLQEQLERLLRRLYGRRSERLDPSQLSLFAEDQEATRTTPPVTTNTDSGGQGRQRRTPHGRQRLPEYLQRQDIRHELTEAERACPCCGQQRVVLGEEVSEQLEFVPASLLVRRHVRVTYLCQECEHNRQQPQATVAATVAASECATEHNPTQTASGCTTPERSAVPVPSVLPVGEHTMTTAAADTTVTEVAQQLTTNGPPKPEPPLSTALCQQLTPTTPVAGTLPPTAASSATHAATASSSPTTTATGVPECSRPPSTFITAPMPPQPIAKCLAGPGLLAHVIVNKFADHLPLYRQEQIFWRQGVWLSRSTLCDWLAGCATALEPLLGLMWQRVFQSRELHTDDTPVTVQRQQTKGHLWVYVGDGLHPYTVYDFTLGRRQERPLECLSAFKGYLHADAYNGYDKAFGQDRIEVGCWAHTRRYFYDARTSDPVRACCVLSLIGRLYALEAAAKYAAQVRKLSDIDFWEVRYQLRQRQAVPLLSSLREYAEQQRPVVLPRSPSGEAFTYLDNQWPALQRYVEHGFLDIDNNVGEQALRAVGVGRKNWLFLGSQEGGRTAATLYSMVATCKRHGLDPWFYLREVLTILPTLTETTRPTELPKLLPDEWARLQRQSHSGTASPERSE